MKLADAIAVSAAAAIVVAAGLTLLIAGGAWFFALLIFIAFDMAMRDAAGRRK